MRVGQKHRRSAVAAIDAGLTVGANVVALPHEARVAVELHQSHVAIRHLWHPPVRAVPQDDAVEEVPKDVDGSQVLVVSLRVETIRRHAHILKHRCALGGGEHILATSLAWSPVHSV